jgi:hypothetical protein
MSGSARRTCELRLAIAIWSTKMDLALTALDTMSYEIPTLGSVPANDTVETEKGEGECGHGRL